MVHASALSGALSVTSQASGRSVPAASRRRPVRAHAAMCGRMRWWPPRTQGGSLGTSVAAATAQMTVPLCAMSWSSRTGRNPIRSTLTFQCCGLRGGVPVQVPVHVYRPGRRRRQRRVREHERQHARAYRRGAHPFETGLVQHPSPVHIVVPEHEPLNSGRLTPPFLVVRQEAAVDAYVAQADDRLRGADQLVPGVHHDLVQLVRHLERPVEGDYRRYVAQVQVRPDPRPARRSRLSARPFRAADA